jgi:hypothetical protein
MGFASIGIRAKELGAAGYESSYSCDICVRHGLVGNNRIHSGRRGEVRKQRARQIGRAKNHSAGDTIEFDQRQRGSQLISYRDEHRSSAQMLKPTGEARTPSQIAQRHRCIGTDKRAAREVFLSTQQTVSPEAVLVDLYEILEGDRKLDILRYGERIEAKLVFEPSNNHSKTERVEAGLEQHQIIRQWRQLLILLFGHRFELRSYPRSH